MNKQTMKQWELEKGLKIKDAKGFKGEKNKKRTSLYTEQEFKQGAKKSEIICKTDKGLRFLNK